MLDMSTFTTNLGPWEIEEAMAELLGENQQRNALVRKLEWEFRRQSVESGYSHPAEDVMEAALRGPDGLAVEGWLMLTFFYWLRNGRESTAADLLICIGRLDADIAGSWANVLASTGLKSVDIEVRDAAIRLFEHRADAYALNRLTTHLDEEPSKWLREYTEQVVKDIS